MEAVMEDPTVSKVNNPLGDGEKAKKYLDLHLQDKPSLTPEQETALDRNLFTPLENVDYQDKGHVSVEKGDFQMSFDYELPDSDELDKIVKQLRNVNEFRGQQKTFDPSQFRKISNLSLQNSKATLNMSEALPKGTSVYVNPFVKTYESNEGMFDPDGKRIIIEGDPTMLATVAFIEHEGGHRVNIERADDPNYLASLETARLDTYLPLMYIEDQNAARVLKDERDAWAFALKQLKPFIGNGIDKEALYDLIHGGKCLKTYEDRIKEYRE